MLYAKIVKAFGMLFSVRCLVLVTLFSFTLALKHHLSIHKDDRTIFKIETFGFLVDGEMKLRISDFSMHLSAKEKDEYKVAIETTHTNHTAGQDVTILPHLIKNGTSKGSEYKSTARRLEGIASQAKNLTKHKIDLEPPKYLVGFVLRHANSESTAQTDLENIIEHRRCLLEQLHPNDVFVDMSESENWGKIIELTHKVTEQNVGLYSLVFARCYPAGVHYTSFKLDATFYNPGPNYLSAGDYPLPTVYFIFFLAFAGAMLTWVAVLHQKGVTPEDTPKVHRIHYLMLALIILKSLSLFFESVRFHYIALYGASELWSAVYYVFAFMKGIMLFMVILLIGSGWSLMKSYLSDNEKRIVWVVLILQVLDNIAMIVLEETAPGSQGWLTWRDILHLVDIICCCAILVPIVWSIRHLKQAADVDGKAQNSLQKLQLFRSFYIMVVLYIYITRIAVYIVTATVPFYLLWLGPCTTEGTTFLFFTITGYNFRPQVNNPYLPVKSEDAEEQEYGLDEDEADREEGILMGSRKNDSRV